MSDTIESTIQELSPDALIELFVLDMTHIAGGELLRFHAGTNSLRTNVVWQGQTYVALPIQADGFEISGRGTLPRPKIRIANTGGVLSADVKLFDDLVGSKITRKRTFKRFLDAVNFAGGNPTADPDQYLPDDTWFVDQKMSENRVLIEWELASAFDLLGVQLPYRQVIQNTCTWQYRGAECGWAGGYFDANDQPTTAGGDKCGKRLSSCKARFGAQAILPYGGFPGAILYGQ